MFGKLKSCPEKYEKREKNRKKNAPLNSLSSQEGDLTLWSHSVGITVNKKVNINEKILIVVFIRYTQGKL